VLEIPFIKPTSQATDALQSAGRRQTATQRDDANDNATFDTAYDASEEDAVAETAADGQTQAKDDGAGEGSDADNAEKDQGQAKDASTQDADSLGNDAGDMKTDFIEAGGGAVAARGTEAKESKGDATEAPRLDRKPNPETARALETKPNKSETATDTQSKTAAKPSPLETVLAAKVAETGAKAQSGRDNSVVQQLSETAPAKGAASDIAAARALAATTDKSVARTDAATAQMLSSEFSKKLETTLDERRARSEGLVRSDSAALATAPKQAPPATTLLPKAPAIETLKVADVSDTTKPVVADVDGALPAETRTTGTTSAPTFGQVLARAETPGLMARQMAEALQRLPDKPVEIALNPRELGRVRMSISAAEAGITVNVLAERPETLDLMRRNIEQLTVEFEAIGYSNINFAFAEGEAQQSFSEEADSGSSSDRSVVNLEIDDEDVPRTAQMQVATGVDIRL